MYSPAVSLSCTEHVNPVNQEILSLPLFLLKAVKTIRTDRKRNTFLSINTPLIFFSIFFFFVKNKSSLHLFAVFLRKKVENDLFFRQSNLPEGQY